MEIEAASVESRERKYGRMVAGRVDPELYAEVRALAKELDVPIGRILGESLRFAITHGEYTAGPMDHRRKTVSIDRVAVLEVTIPDLQSEE